MSKTDFEETITRTRQKLSELESELKSLQASARSQSFAPKHFPELPEIDGIRMATAECGIKYKDRLDTLLVEIAPGSAIAGLFTTSRTKSAPVIWCEHALKHHQNTPDSSEHFGIIVNSGNSNAFTGKNGHTSVEQTAIKVADALKTQPEHIFVASTGVIGQPLPHDKIINKVSALKSDLMPSDWEKATRAIMTTDQWAKAAGATCLVENKTVNISAIAKGAGMIAPDMATMLVFIFTDAVVERNVLQEIVKDISNTTFNAITVDGDTSTSDTLLMVATKRAGHTPITVRNDTRLTAFKKALRKIMLNLSKQIVSDGEGATKLAEISVTGAKSARAAKKIAMSIANSPLVKTALAGQDPNWGRIVAAVGKSGEEADRDKLSIRFGDILVAENGLVADSYTEEQGAKYMLNERLKISVDVGIGSGKFTVWTCDLGHPYVTVNADYRS